MRGRRRRARGRRGSRDQGKLEPRGDRQDIAAFNHRSSFLHTGPVQDGNTDCWDGEMTTEGDFKERLRSERPHQRFERGAPRTSNPGWAERSDVVVQRRGQACRQWENMSFLLSHQSGRGLAGLVSC